MHLFVKNLWLILSLILVLITNLKKCFLQSYSNHENDENEIYEIRIYETALPGTKATLNEAFDRLMREQKNCFAQLETASDLDWIEFDPALLMFLTIAKVPSNAKTTQQAVLHLMCSSNKMQTIHFLIHVTRRNKHPPKFLHSQYQFYVPINVKIGFEVGQLQVIDNDPIIYNSQVQLTILPNFAVTESRTGIHYKLFPANNIVSNEHVESYWQIHKNGSLVIKKAIKNLKIYHHYTIRVLAVDFGSPQLFSICNVTIIPVIISQPKNVRINVANTRYQIIEWDSPHFGVAEKFRLTISRNKTILYTQDIEANKNIVLSKMRFSPGDNYNAIITAVDIEGNTPSDPHSFMLTKNELECDGDCSPNAGTPLCYYSRFHKIEQYHDSKNVYCLCYHGFTSPQCDIIESCFGEQSIEDYGNINWPFTSVNKSVSIPCPYNTNKETLKRTCIWDEKLEIARWENVSKNEICKKQNTILVHLGVLANYAERADQTASGLRAVLRFLNSILQMPAFKVEIIETQFDVKIAEHVAQVIDTIAGLNVSAIVGNTTSINNELVYFLIKFSQQIPVPFNLQSSKQGLHLKTWHWLTSPSSFELHENDKIADEFPIQFARRCYVHLPSRRRQKLEAKGQLIFQNKSSSLSQIVRVACLRASKILPFLDGYSPILFVTIDNSNKTSLKKKRSNLNNKKSFKTNISSKNSLNENHYLNQLKFLKRQKIAGNAKALIALRLESISLFDEKMLDKMNMNYTCAIYDHNMFGWSISGITILSRNFEDGFVLCETSYFGTFALLPEKMFKTTSSFSFKVFFTIMPIISVVFTILSTFFLFCLAILQRPKYIDPALVIFLFTIFVIHAIYFVVLIAPHIFSHVLLLEYDRLIYLIIQYCLISIAALITLLNASTYTRMVDLELGVKNIISFYCRMVTTFMIGICIKCSQKIVLKFLVLPILLCLFTWIFNGYIYYGIATLNPQFQSFNGIFILTFVLPLIIFIGSSTGYSIYSYYYAHVLANSNTPPLNHHITLLYNNIAELSKHRLLKDLANSSLISTVIFVLFYANAIVFYLFDNILRNILLTLFYLSISVGIFFFAGLLYRIELKFPRYLNTNIYENSQQSTATADNNFNQKLKEKLCKNVTCNRKKLLLSNDECNLIPSVKDYDLHKIQLPRNVNNENLTHKIIYDTLKNNLVPISYKDEDEDSGRLTLNSPHQTSLKLKKNELPDTIVDKPANESPISNLGTLSNSSNASSQIQTNLKFLKNDIDNKNIYLTTAESTDSLFKYNCHKSQPITSSTLKINHVWTKPILNNAKKTTLSNNNENLFKHQFNNIMYKTSALQQQKKEENKIFVQDFLKLNQVYSSTDKNEINVNKNVLNNFTENNEDLRFKNIENYIENSKNFNQIDNVESKNIKTSIEKTTNFVNDTQNKVENQKTLKNDQNSNISNNKKDESNSYLNHPIVSVV